MSSIADIIGMCPNSYRLVSADGGQNQMTWGANNIFAGITRNASDVWRVPDEELGMFCRILEGYPPENMVLTDEITIQTYVPLRFPFLTNVIAENYRVAGVGPAMGCGDRYRNYNVSVDYASPQFQMVGAYALKSESSSDGSTSFYTPNRFVFPNHCQNRQITLHKVAIFNNALYIANQGTVNSQPWKDNGVGQALFQSPSFTEDYLSDGSISRTVNLSFLMGPYDHNIEFNEFNVAYFPTVTINGQTRRKHLYVDFASLFGV